MWKGDSEGPPERRTGKGQSDIAHNTLQWRELSPYIGWVKTGAMVYTIKKTYVQGEHMQEHKPQSSTIQDPSLSPANPRRPLATKSISSRAKIAATVLSSIPAPICWDGPFSAISTEVTSFKSQACQRQVWGTGSVVLSFANTQPVEPGRNCYCLRSGEIAVMTQNGQ